MYNTAATRGPPSRQDAEAGSQLAATQGAHPALLPRGCLLPRLEPPPAAAPGPSAVSPLSLPRHLPVMSAQPPAPHRCWHRAALRNGYHSNRRGNPILWAPATQGGSTPYPYHPLQPPGKDGARAGGAAGEGQRRQEKPEKGWSQAAGSGKRGVPFSPAFTLIPWCPSPQHSPF